MHIGLAHHVPGMHEDRHTEFFARGKEIEKARVAEIQLIHVCPDLHTAEADRLAPLKLIDGESGILQRHGPESDETKREIGDDIGDVII